MIAFEEARNEVISEAEPIGKERAKLAKLSGLVLAEPLQAEHDLPSFDNSAVDGFGVLVSDIFAATATSPIRLNLRATIQAGDPGNIMLTPGTTVKILTGAVVPKGIEAVVMKEFCQQDNGFVLVGKSVRKGENIRHQGEEFTKGQVVLAPGILITPSVVGMIASLGRTSALVFKRPRVCILSTGNELIKPGKCLLPGQVYDSNSYALMAALNGFGVKDPLHLHARDDKKSTTTALINALRQADVIISAGGVSVGDFDFVKEVAEELGIETKFWKVALKPGKPVYFGVYSSRQLTRPHKKITKKLVFGLPGNPVSALVTFHQLVKPALLKMLGLKITQPIYLTARLSKTVEKKPGRLEFVRGLLKNKDGLLTVMPTIGQESHMMGGLTEANCLIHFPLEKVALEQDEEVLVEMLNWSSSG